MKGTRGRKTVPPTGRHNKSGTVVLGNSKPQRDRVTPVQSVQDVPDLEAATLQAGTIPETLIEIDQAVPSGAIHGRLDMQIRGRPVSSTAIEEVALLVYCSLIARVQFGQAPSAAAVFPDGTTGFERAFQFLLPRSLEHAEVACHCIIRTRTIEGRIDEEPFQLAVGPTGTGPVTVVSGPTQPSVSFTGEGPPIMLYGRHPKDPRWRQ